MYEIYNNIEDKIIFSGNGQEFKDFTRKIRDENEDQKYKIRSVLDAQIYINQYCDNLNLTTG